MPGIQQIINPSTSVMMNSMINCCISSFHMVQGFVIHAERSLALSSSSRGTIVFPHSDFGGRNARTHRRFILLEFEGAMRPSNSSPSRGYWWAFGPPIWAISPSKHLLDINGCHDMTIFYLCAKFQLSSMIRSASRTPRP